MPFWCEIHILTWWRLAKSLRSSLVYQSILGPFNVLKTQAIFIWAECSVFFSIWLQSDFAKCDKQRSAPKGPLFSRNLMEIWNDKSKAEGNWYFTSNNQSLPYNNPASHRRKKIEIMYFLNQQKLTRIQWKKNQLSILGKWKSWSREDLKL